MSLVYVDGVIELDSFARLQSSQRPDEFIFLRVCSYIDQIQVFTPNQKPPHTINAPVNSNINDVIMSNHKQTCPQGLPHINFLKTCGLEY